MQGLSLNPQNANTYLSRLFRDAAGKTANEGAGLKSKGLQIADSLTDPDKKISLKGPEVDRLLAHVEGLPAADRADAVQVLDLFRDKFEISDEAARKKLLDFVPKTAAPIDVSGRVRSVADAKIEAATAPKTASAKHIKEADGLIDAAANAAGGGKAGEALAGEMHKAAQSVFSDGDVKADPDGGRKAYVETSAKRNNGDPTMALFDKYARSPFFEDRLMAALGRSSLKFMNEMNEKLSTFDDPKREDEMRGLMKDNIKQLLAQADRISPDGKAKVAAQIAAFVKDNPDFDGPPELKQFLSQVKANPAASDGHDDLLGSLPPIDNSVVSAMEKSDRREVREWAAVFKAAHSAENIKRALGSADVDSLGEDKLHHLMDQAHDFQAELGAVKSMLPEDVQKELPDVKLKPLPAQIDPTSRQVMFQQINLMMNQYQQIMQAMSEIINKMNEMAMDPIRKMGR